MIEVGNKYRVISAPKSIFFIVDKVVKVELVNYSDSTAFCVYGEWDGWLRMDCLEHNPCEVLTPIRLTNNALVPFYATAGAAGFDIAANETVTINPGYWVSVATGLHIQLPVEQELQIRSRSGIAKKDGLVVHQGIGTIDSDYRGEIFVMLRNTGLSARTVNRGDRIAQGVIAPVIRVEFEVVDKLDDTVRGDGAFGSSGI